MLCFEKLVADSGAERADEARLVAERHRQAVENHHFAGRERLPSGGLTVSVGVSSFPADGQDELDLFQRADQALFKSKSEGRNKVHISTPDQRKHIRQPIHSKLMYRPWGSDEYRDFKCGLVKNISLGGLSCRTNQPVKLPLI